MSKSKTSKPKTPKTSPKWKEIYPGFEITSAGILNGAIQFVQYESEPPSFIWWVGFDAPTEDKADEYATLQGNADTADKAKAEVLAAMKDLVTSMATGLGMKCS
jgi:hypothetical protein